MGEELFMEGNRDNERVRCEGAKCQGARLSLACRTFKLFGCDRGLEFGIGVCGFVDSVVFVDLGIAFLFLLIYGCFL